MASSGTYAYAPDIAEFVDEAFERAGIDPATLTGKHLRSARRSLNLMFAEWANRSVHLFAIDEQTQTVTQGLESYTATTGTLAMLEVVVRRSGVDTPVHRISRADYHAIPNKTKQGLPTQLYFDRKTGTYKLWNVPENSTDVIRYYRLRQLQDVTAGQETPDVPYRWYEALAAGLAAKVSLKFNKQVYGMLKAEAEEKFAQAKLEDRERVDTSFTLDLPA